MRTFQIATSIQGGFRLLNKWRSYCEALALMVYTRQFPSLESASEAGLRIEGGPVLQITPSERYALQLIAQGTPTSQMGAMLGLAGSDVDPFLATLFTRLGVTSRADAVRVASRRGLVTPEVT